MQPLCPVLGGCPVEQGAAEQRDCGVPEPGEGVVAQMEGVVEDGGGEVDVGCGEGGDNEEDLAAGPACSEEEQAAADGRYVEADAVQGVREETAENGDEEDEVGGHIGDDDAGAVYVEFLGIWARSGSFALIRMTDCSGSSRQLRT